MDEPGGVSCALRESGEKAGAAISACFFADCSGRFQSLTEFPRSVKAASGATMKILEILRIRRMVVSAPDALKAIYGFPAKAPWQAGTGVRIWVVRKAPDVPGGEDSGMSRIRRRGMTWGVFQGRLEGMSCSGLNSGFSLPYCLL